MSGQSKSQIRADALEVLIGRSTVTLVIGKRILVARRILSNLVKVTPFWLNADSDEITPKNGAFPHAD